MNLKKFILCAAVAAALVWLPMEAFAWGCSRSVSGSSSRGGSFSHTGSTSGGWGNWSHTGSTSVTGRYGNTYTASSSASGHYSGGSCYHYGGYGGYHYGGGYGGAFAAGAITGAAVGAAATAAAYNAPPPTYPYYPPGVFVRPRLF